MQNIAKKWWVLFGVGITSIIVAIDFTVVNTVLPQIRNEFNVNMDSLHWIMTGFGITFSASLITMGRLADLYGRRKILFLGMLGFGIASLIAGFAATILQLIIARLLQGFFGAVIFPVGLAITSEAFPLKEQGKALGIYGSILGTGLALGPILGGIIASVSNWRWIFFLAIPLIFLSWLICFFVVDESRVKKKIPIDWIGVSSLTIALAAFVFAFTQSEFYGWSSPLIIGPFALFVILSILFIYTEKHATFPVLPPELFFNKFFFIAATVYCISIGLVWTIMFYVPLYLQVVYGFDVLSTGLMLLPMTVMTIVAPTIAGLLYDKEGPFIASVSAFVFSIVGLFLFLFFGQGFSWIITIVAFICIGLSWGIGNGVGMPLALSNKANREYEALISGVAITVLNIFGVIVLALCTTQFHYIHQGHLKMGQSEIQAFIAGFQNISIFLLSLAVLGFVLMLWVFRKTGFKKF